MKKMHTHTTEMMMKGEWENILNVYNLSYAHCINVFVIKHFVSSPICTVYILPSETDPPFNQVDRIEN